MKRSFWVLSSAALVLSACGGAEQARGPALRYEGPDVRALALPDGSEAGARIEPRVVLDAPHLKLVAIVLRGGAELPVHTAPSAVTIQAVSGSGVVRVGEEEHPLDATHLVSLAPEVPHSVVPAGGADLVLLVHHLRGTGGGSR
ncbi:MAG: hypothetical protein M5U28_14610 [Sandaracinaceae bacterium]|nr:hypothetical protein [Sandaracinaceae bacterium]